MVKMVNVRKTKKEACGAQDCKKLKLPRMTQCKKLTLGVKGDGEGRRAKGAGRMTKGKGALCVQGKPKPVLNKKAKTTKKMLLQFQCQNCTFYFS
ncbi:large subunit ribosomal protein L44e [Marchantia polymorpha subsp. ruderalis]|nr:hypothetical protein Mp_5g04450 [Marchantia polymorpha subsp. ruderalis]